MNENLSYENWGKYSFLIFLTVAKDVALWQTKRKKGPKTTNFIVTAR